MIKELFKRTHTPLDTNIVFLHRLLVIVMLAIFAYCKYAQMERQSPSCSGSGTINLEHQRKLRLCITTTAFVDYKGERKYTNGFGLYLPPVLFIMALVYMVPHVYQKYYEDEKVVALFEKASSLPRDRAVRNIDVVIMYNYRMLSRRLRLSWECLEANVISLLILDMISSINLLSEIIVGGIREGWDHVLDMWRLAYPTNVKCEIGPQMVYAASNTFHYRCIIPHNEIYKYIWMVAATVALISLVLSVFSFVYHLVQMFPIRRKQFFKNTVDIDKDTFATLTDQLPGGDDSMFLLKSYLLRLPCKDLRQDVVQELMTILKETSL